MSAVPLRVLFVCVENSCRSQMAEGLARLLFPGVLDAHSSGSRPSGTVHPKAVASLRALGYDLTRHSSKPLDAVPQIEWDWAITMGCGDECPNVRSKRRADWGIPDPKHLEAAEFDAVRDLIRTKVEQLASEAR
jgi:protein-tyrosine-phosphatase